MQQQSAEAIGRPRSGAEAARWAREAPEQLRAAFAQLTPAEIASLVADAPDEEARRLLLETLPTDKRAEVLLELPEGVQRALLRGLSVAELEGLITTLSSDDAADMLQQTHPIVANEVLRRLPAADRREIAPLMAHDEETAGGLMQAELFKVRADWTVGRVVEVLRRWGRGIENLSYVYAVDDDDRLVGVLPIVQLLLHDEDEVIGSIVERDFPRAFVGQDREEVARLFEQHDVLALPVVDEEGRLVGRITADDILDVVQEEATEDMYRLAQLSDEDDLAEPVTTTARRRGVWLLVNLGTAILASSVIALFQDTISQIVALAVLMPIVASMGGIAGTQTLTVIVRNLALGRITFANAKRALFKEILVGLVAGAAFALLMGAIAVAWFPSVGMRLGLVIGLAMLINLIVAAAAGALVPLALKRFGIDPALASGTIVTTFTDVVGFFAFLGLARWLLLS